MNLLLILLCLYSLTANAIEKAEEIELPPFHHIVKIKPSDQRKIDKHLELSDNGELVCSTCHGLKDIDKTPIDKVDTKASNFLHGGPYKPLTDFCYRCHDKKANSRENIHILLDENGEIKEQSCKYCHKEVPDREKQLKPEELQLRLPMDKICFGCHLKDPHFNSVEHQVKPERDEMLDHLKKMRKKNAIFLPLSNKNEVICISCHTPHQKGVIDVNKPAGKQVDNNDLEKGILYKNHPWSAVFSADKAVRLEKLNQQLNSHYKLTYQRLDKEALLRLPAIDGQLCLMCHTFKD